MARNKSVYTKAMAVSEEDKLYIQQIRLLEGKQSDAGTLAMIIKFYRDFKKINSK